MMNRLLVALYHLRSLGQSWFLSLFGLTLVSFLCVSEASHQEVLCMM